MADATAELEVLVEIKKAIEGLNTLKTETKKTSDSMSSAFGAIKTAAAAAVAILAGREVVGFFRDGIEAAVAQENAMNKLSQALSLTGENSQAALAGFAEFANKLEITTNVADDVVLSQLALAKSFGLTNKEAQDLVSAAVDLSAATGDDLEGSVRTLGKTFAGVTGKLDEQVTALKGLTKEQLANGDAIAIVAKRYKGSAAKAIDTFSGSIESASNAFGNFKEAIGEAVVSSPQIVTAAKEIAAAFNQLTSDVEGSGLKEAVSTVVNAILAGLSALSEFTVGVARIVQSAFEVVNRAFSGILLLAEGFADNFTFVTAAIDKAINAPLAGLKLLIDTSGSITTLFDGDTTELEKLSEKVGGLKTNIEGLYQQEVVGGIKSVNDKFVDFAIGVEESVDGAISGIEDFAIGIDGAALKVASASQKVTDNTRTESDKRRAIYDDEAKDAAKAFEKELAEAEKVAADFDKLRIKAHADAKKRREDDAKDAKETAQRLREEVEAIAANPISFVITSNVEALDLDPASQKLAAGIAGGIDAALNGKEGAKNLISGAAGAFADALIPGLGPAITSIVGKLAEGPEATKAFIREFVAAVPDIVEAIGESAPALVEALVDSLINEGGAIRIGVAIAKAMAGEGVYKAIGKQIGAEFGSAFNSSNIAQTIAGAFGLGAQKLREFPAALNAAITRFQTAGKEIGTNISDSIKDLPANIRTAFSDATSDLGTKISTGISEAITGIGAAIGAGFANLALPAAFQPLTDAITSLSNTVTSLANSLGGGGGDKGGAAGVIQDVSRGDFSGFDPSSNDNYYGFGLTGGGDADSAAVLSLLGSILDRLSEPQEAKATVQFNSKTLADIILQLNRNGARLTA